MPSGYSNSIGSQPERVLVAIKLLSQMRPESVRAALMEQFRVGRTTAGRDIHAAYVKIAEDADAQMPYLRGVMYHRLTRMMDKAEDVGNTHGAVMAAREIIRIFGLAAPVELAVTDKRAKRYAELTDSQLDVLVSLEGDDDDDGETEHDSSAPH